MPRHMQDEYHWTREEHGRKQRYVLKARAPQATAHLALFAVYQLLQIFLVFTGSLGNGCLEMGRIHI